MIEALTALVLLTMGLWLFQRAEKAFNRGTASELLFLPKYPLITFIAMAVFLTGLLLAMRCLSSTIKGKREQRG